VELAHSAELRHRIRSGRWPAVSSYRRSRHPGVDSGDGVQIAPLNPWLHIYYATTGVNSFDDKVNADQQLTRAEALRPFTRNNSWFPRMEDKIGSIERGKLADLAVLDRDYFSVPDVEIKKIHSVLTMVDGEIVHDAGVL
jgi:predicted amidohydrolase YtcJ